MHFVYFIIHQCPPCGDSACAATHIHGHNVSVVKIKPKIAMRVHGIVTYDACGTVKAKAKSISRVFDPSKNAMEVGERQGLITAFIPIAGLAGFARYDIAPD